jgi:hypothetical protein
MELSPWGIYFGIIEKEKISLFSTVASRHHFTANCQFRGTMVSEKCNTVGLFGDNRTTKLAVRGPFGEFVPRYAQKTILTESEDNPPDLISLIYHLYRQYSRGRCFETIDF